MAKNSITDYSKTAASNTDIQSVDIAEGCLPSGINNAIRELMADLAAVNDGTVSLTSPSFAAASITGDLTVDTNTLHVDSTNNRVGVGTSSVSESLHIADGGKLRLERPDGATYSNISMQAGGGGGLNFFNNNNDGFEFEYATGGVQMKIDNSGNVGIGTTLPEEKLTVAGIRNEATLRLKQLESASDWSNGDDLGAVEFSTSDPSGAGSGVKGSLRYQTIGGTGAGTYMSFNVAGTTSGTNNSERLRIDSSGNVLVGKTSCDSTTAGVDLRPEGVGVFVRDANRPLIANRLTDDGELIQFRKDGTAVGSIDNDGADRLIVNSENTTGYLAVDGAVKFRWRTNDFIPHDDNAKDLGVSGARFKDLYLSGGVYLGGTGSANKLDDYEEGTFVPTVTATSGSVTMTAFDDAAYTKIGRQVTVQGRLDVSSVSSPTGNLTIGNLPFVIASLAALSDRSVQYGFITIGSGGTGNPVVCEFVENTSEAVLRTEAWSGAASILTTNSRIQFSWTYFTT